MNEKEIFQRTELLVGSEAMAAITRQRVLLVGVGGVGSWCAESLVRSGIRHLTIVDCDKVCVSNINRQLMATTSTIGLAKVDVLRRRLLDINPVADILALEQLFSQDSAKDLELNDYDYVVDAIDSLRDKALLIEMACASNAKLFSSMGAALKMDPSRIRVAEFWKVTGDPLARALRNKFKKEKRFPRRKFQCVFSDELLVNHDVPLYNEEKPTMINKPQTNGTVAHITAIFGFTLAGLVVQDIIEKQYSR